MRARLQGGAHERARVGADMFVSLAYRLYDDRGALRDVVRRARPLCYVHGHAQILPGLEAAVEGWRLGQQGTVELDPEEAFGERDEEAVVEMDAAELGGRPRVGDEVVARGRDDELVLTVVAVAGGRVRLDPNHPLAGRRVRFVVEVCGLRPATDAELDRAQADIEERIRREDAIVYDAADGGAEPMPDGAEPSAGPQLLQLRRKPAPE
ncbi:MAG: peptidylprolyl isomerase [Polyangiaceae bacterium]|nr:peptidylprolyl isomerase [Polyangiaceae bacterium]